MLPALELENVGKEFISRNGLLSAKTQRVVAVDDISLKVREGEVFGVLGPNGSGKSTLIRLVATLLLPDRGSIRVFGHDVVRDSLLVRRLINRVSVEASFFKKLSSWENLSYSARLYGLPPREARLKAVDILQRLGMEEKKLEVSMETLSRGMQQKVAVARALLSSPRLLLLDEPTTGLDPRSRREVRSFVRDLTRGEGTTVILTTHDMEEADELCERIAIMHEGRVVALDTPRGLKQTHGPRSGEGTLEEVFLATTGMEWEEALV